MVDHEISVETNIGTLFLFHPDDLTHREHSPLGWYGYGFARRKDEAAGRLMVWGTEADGDHRLRITTGSLTQEELSRACDSCVFPFVVRHGRVLASGGDALPGGGHRDDPETFVDDWFDMPEGSYRVIVHALNTTGGYAHLPHFVLAFQAVTDLAGVGVNETMPVLDTFAPPRPFNTSSGPSRVPASASRRLAEIAEDEAPFLWRGEPPPADPLSLLAVPPDILAVPGQSVVRRVSDPIAEHFCPKGARPAKVGLVLAVAAEPGRLGLTTSCTGYLWGLDGYRLTLVASAVVRIVSVRPHELLDRTCVEEVPKPDMAAGSVATAAFRSRLMTEVTWRETSTCQDGMTAPAFELERLDTLASAEAVTGWALAHLPMPFERRLELLASPACDRMTAILLMLDEAGSIG